MEPKLILSSLATLLGILSFLPYIVEILRGRTRPHAYSYLIWTITLFIAAAAASYGGASTESWMLMTWGGLMLFIFALSLKYGTRSINRFDGFVLILALISVALWMKLDHPLFAVYMAAFIDVLAYLPTIRKTYDEPYSESLTSWALYSFAGLLGLIALEAFNPYTATYLLAIFIANIVLIAIALLRRKRLI